MARRVAIGVQSFETLRMRNCFYVDKTHMIKEWWENEYDTPMQEAYVGGYWEELSAFLRNLFHAMFKSNPYLERAIMTGITRGSKESIFSDLNHLRAVTTTSEEYADCFGFTEEGQRRRWRKR